LDPIEPLVALVEDTDRGRRLFVEPLVALVEDPDRDRRLFAEPFVAPVEDKDRDRCSRVKTTCVFVSSTGRARNRSSWSWSCKNLCIKSSLPKGERSSL
jgi:hypothetical protein